MTKSRVNLFFLILVAVSIQLFLFEQKEIFHIDELFSFALANGKYGIYLYHLAEEINDKALTGDVFREYLTQGDETSFVTMWHNLSGDNHMPIYFVLLRTLGCFFDPYVFSAIPGIILNVLILIALLLTFYKLAQNIFKGDNKIALLSVGILMFSYAVLSLEIYIRMYLLQMFLSVLLVYGVFCYLDKNKVTVVEACCLLLVTVMNILCHYYSIVFCFVVIGAGGLFILCEKDKKKLLLFLSIMFVGFLSAYFIYPEMIEVGVHGERGSQLVALFGEMKEEFFSIFARQIEIISDTIFGNLYTAIVALSISFWVGVKDKKSGFLFVSFWGYAFLIGMIMPLMVGFQIRYFAPIIPVGVILFVQSVVFLAESFKVNRFYIGVFLSLCIVCEAGIALTRKNNTFYFIGTRDSRKMDKLVNNADIWWGLGGRQEHAWIIHIYADRLSNSKNIWILNDFENEEFKKFAEKEKKDGRYAYLLLPKGQETSPKGAIDWVKRTTGRQAYYLFTVKNDKMSAMVLEAAVFLVCPF